jgi:squalene-hopene/tetraprenyl-beta-curcumene cyclase
MEGAAMSRRPASDCRDAQPAQPAAAGALGMVRDRLLQCMHADGFWEGWLSSSALATATAVSALSLAADASDAARIGSGTAWLTEHQNADGGWGDTTDSPSNLATTLLAVAAMKLAGAAEADRLPAAAALERAEGHIALRAGRDEDGIINAIRREYGEDRTFAVPILMNCGLAGLVSWDQIPGLPFELAAVPHAWYKLLRLHVVSYALPALIAIGLLIDRRNPPRRFARRLLRRAITPHVLEKLRQIQPEHGGFLEATPLTSFVAMALVPAYGRDQCVAARCLQFLRQSQRADGSWPIDTNLSAWLTTAAVAALAAAGELSRIDRQRTARWISARQYEVLHPYTHAAPGGWSWTHLPGGVPDVDDTSGAIIALSALGHRDGIDAGVRWLLELQNGDGGWPTFCRGWGKLPFDQSAPDLTAHALRALCCASPSPGRLPPGEEGDRPGLDEVNPRLLRRAVRRGRLYLHRAQQAGGAWTPLWFGNQASPGQANPVLGTSRVLRALEVLDRDGPPAARGVAYLLGAQNPDGGWGGAKAVASSLEETAMAVGAVVPWATGSAVRSALVRGVHHLVHGLDDRLDRPAPIGLYFAHLWYSERLYPLLWTLEALGRALPCVALDPFDVSQKA